MAALRSGITTVIIPSENEKDLEEIDQTVRNALNFVTADHVDRILDIAFQRRLKPKHPHRKEHAAEHSAELRQ